MRLTNRYSLEKFQNRLPPVAPLLEVQEPVKHQVQGYVRKTSATFGEEVDTILVYLLLLWSKR